MFLPVCAALDNRKINAVISTSYAYSVFIQLRGALTDVFSRQGGLTFYGPMEFNLHLFLKGEFAGWLMNSPYTVPFSVKIAFASEFLPFTIAPIILLLRRHG